MKDLRAVILAPLMLLPVALTAGQKTPVPVLTEEHWNASKTVGFKTPAGWSVTHTPGDMELTEARGDGMMLRIWRRAGGWGRGAQAAAAGFALVPAPSEVTRKDGKGSCQGWARTSGCSS